MGIWIPWNSHRHVVKHSLKVSNIVPKCIIEYIILYHICIIETLISVKITVIIKHLKKKYQVFDKITNIKLFRNSWHCLLMFILVKQVWCVLLKNDLTESQCKMLAKIYIERDYNMWNLNRLFWNIQGISKEYGVQFWLTDWVD